MRRYINDIRKYFGIMILLLYNVTVLVCQVDSLPSSNADVMQALPGSDGDALIVQSTAPPPPIYRLSRSPFYPTIHLLHGATDKLNERGWRRHR